VTRPTQEGRKKQRRRSGERDDRDRFPASDVEAFVRQLDRQEATEQMYQRLLEELKRLDDERRVAGRRATRNRTAKGLPSEADRANRGRELAASVAVFLTGLAVVSLALRYIPPIFGFDPPILGRIGGPGRPFMTNPLVPLVPLWASVAAWGVWALIAARQKRPTQKRPRLGRPRAEAQEGSTAH
jgi:hypothetical protein